MAENNHVQVSFGTAMAGGQILRSGIAGFKLNALITCSFAQIALHVGCKTLLPDCWEAPFSRLSNRVHRHTIFILNSCRDLNSKSG